MKLKIDLANNSPQNSVHEVLVQERRGLLSGKTTAVFSVTVEAKVSEANLYIPETDDGWLMGRIIGHKENTSMPAYLKVRHDRVELKREYFTVLEGLLQGVQLWISLNGQGKSHLPSNNPQTGPASLTYSRTKKTLQMGNKIYQTTDDPDSPWKVGAYDLEIPDAPHHGGIYYPNVKYAKVWFRIGHSGERYLHTGTHSLGCITMIEQEKWDELCKDLMKARKGDGRSIGILEVIA